MPERRLWPPLCVLLGLHGAALMAGFLAPYDPTAQHRTLSRAPAIVPHIRDAEGGFHSPFVYRLVEKPESFFEYEEEVSERFPLRWLESDAGGGRRLVSVDAPGALFLLGTDRYGRDLWSRFWYGARVSLSAGLMAGLLAVVLGTLLGAAAGFYGGAADALLMRSVELFLALPWLYLVLAVRAFLPLDMAPEKAFFLLTILVALIGWASPARLARGVALALREREFIHAARAMGAPDLYVLGRHVLPQIAGLALTQLTILVPRYVLAEVTLSFLGMGVAEPAPSWGNMLAELRSLDRLADPGGLLSPAFALVVVVLSYHRLASALENRWGTASA